MTIRILNAILIVAAFQASPWILEWLSSKGWAFGAVGYCVYAGLCIAIVSGVYCVLEEEASF